VKSVIIFTNKLRKLNSDWLKLTGEFLFFENELEILLYRQNLLVKNNDTEEHRENDQLCSH